MGFRFGRSATAVYVCCACLIGCGGSSGGPTAGPPAAPSAASSKIPAPTATPTSAVPTPSSTPTGVGAACRTTPVTLPGTYTEIVTSGNVAGTTYAQNSGAGTWNAYAYAVQPTPLPTTDPTSTPTPSPAPAKTPKPTPSPSASPSPSGTPTPTPGPAYIAYSGAYTVGSFSGSGANGSYTVGATTGCVLIVTRQDGQPILPGGNYNASGKGDPLFPPYQQVNGTPVATGSVRSLTIDNLGASSGNGTLTLDNGASGTITIQSSQTGTLDRFRRVPHLLWRR